MTAEQKKLRWSIWLPSILWGLLAFLIAKEAGVPVWRDWQIGDATDIGVTAAAAAFYTLRTILEQDNGQ